MTYNKTLKICMNLSVKTQMETLLFFGWQLWDAPQTHKQQHSLQHQDHETRAASSLQHHKAASETGSLDSHPSC